MRHILPVVTVLALVTGCAAAADEAAPEPTPCRTSVVQFQDVAGGVALEAIRAHQPLKLEGCLGGGCFTENLAAWERIDGAYVAKSQDAQRAQWQVRVTEANDAKMYVTVTLAEPSVLRELSVSAAIAPLVRHESGLRRVEAVAERKLVAGEVMTLGNCQ